MFELRLLCPEDQVETLSDALDALDALSVSVEDADAQTDAEQALFGEPGDIEGEVSAEMPAAGDPGLGALLTKARAKLDEVGEEDRAEIIDLMEAIRDAGTDGDAAALDEARRQLQDLLFYLET